MYKTNSQKAIQNKTKCIKKEIYIYIFIVNVIDLMDANFSAANTFRL